MDFVAVEAFVTNLHPRAERTDCGKFLDRELDGFGGRGEAPIADVVVEPYALP